MLSEKPWKPDAVAFLLAGLFVCIGVGSLAAHWALNTEWLHSLGNPRYTRVVVSALFLQLPILAIVAFFVKYHHTTWRAAFGFSRHRWRWLVVVSVGTTLLAIAGTILLKWLSQWIMGWFHYNPPEQPTVTALQHAAGPLQKTLFGILALVVAPVTEECLFRGILYPSLKQIGYRGVALWGTSILFAIFHANAVSLLSLTYFSLLLILLYEETDNLMAPILCHALFNSTSFFWLVIYG